MNIDKIIEMIIMLKLVEKMSGGGGIDLESIRDVVEEVVEEHITGVIYYWEDHEVAVGIVDEKAYLIPQAISSIECNIEVISSVQPYQSQS